MAAMARLDGRFLPSRWLMPPTRAYDATSWFVSLVTVSTTANLPRRYGGRKSNSDKVVAALYERRHFVGWLFGGIGRRLQTAATASIGLAENVVESLRLAGNVQQWLKIRIVVAEEKSSVANHGKITRILQR